MCTIKSCHQNGQLLAVLKLTHPTFDVLSIPLRF